MIRAIMACDRDFGIAKNGQMPWPRNSEDLKWFRTMTVGSCVLMGRKTWDSDMPKPLLKRVNAVVSSMARDSFSVTPHCVVKPTDIENFLKNADRIFSVWIIGGAHLLHSTLDYVEEIHLNRFTESYNCDTMLDIAAIRDRFDETQVDGKLVFTKKR
jgi:dihydrofolate reductase